MLPPKRFDSSTVRRCMESSVPHPDAQHDTTLDRSYCSPSLALNLTNPRLYQWETIEGWSHGKFRKEMWCNSGGGLYTPLSPLSQPSDCTDKQGWRLPRSYEHKHTQLADGRA